MYRKYKTVCIDYGHGGIIDGQYQTAGKQYHYKDESGNVTRSFYEGVFNRKVAAHTINKLIVEGIEVYDVVADTFRTEFVTPADLEQKDVSLSARAVRANEIQSDIFVSIHGNAIGNSLEGQGESAHGFMVYTSKAVTNSDAIAVSILDAAEQHQKLRVRRYDRRSEILSSYPANFYVLRKTYDPAILIEAGFYSNPNDVAYMDSEQGQKDFAKTIVEGLKPWMLIKNKVV